MPSTCIFELDQPDGVYFGGGTINGRLHLKTTSDKPNVAVFIRFHGEGKVQFYYNKHNYNDEETYLDTRTTVFTGGTLPAGTHTYTICIPLPPLCPSTCKLEAGKIRYELSLVIVPSYKVNNVFKQPITVIQHHDLNESSGNAMPLKLQGIKYPSLWDAQPLSFTLFLPRRGYTPGQSIECLLHIDNQTSKTRSIAHCVSLKQIYTFKARRPQKRNLTKGKRFAEVRGVALCDKQKITTHSCELVIPPLPPTSPEEYIISVAYVLKLKIDIGFCSSNLRLYLPIVLGNVPVLQSNMPSMMAENAWKSAFQRSPQSDKPPRYEDCTTDLWAADNGYHWQQIPPGVIPVGANAAVHNHMHTMEMMGSTTSSGNFLPSNDFSCAVRSADTGHAQDSGGYNGDCGGGGGWDSGGGAGDSGGCTADSGGGGGGCGGTD